MSRSFRQPKRFPQKPAWLDKKLEKRAEKAALKRRKYLEDEMEKLLEKYDVPR